MTEHNKNIKIKNHISPIIKESNQLSHRFQQNQTSFNFWVILIHVRISKDEPYHLNIKL